MDISKEVRPTYSYRLYIRYMRWVINHIGVGHNNDISVTALKMFTCGQIDEFFKDNPLLYSMENRLILERIIGKFHEQS